MSERFDEGRPIDVICMGRVAVDLYAEQVGAALDEVSTFRKYLGGCAGNIAVGCARQGLHSALLSCTGEDDMGLFLRKQLKKEGVDQRLMSTTPDHLTALAMLGINPPDRFPLMFYRENCADMQVQPEQCDEAVFSQAKAFLLTGTCLTTTAMRACSEHALTVAKQQKTAIVLDIDYRPVLWGLTAKGDGETRFQTNPSVTSYYQHILPYCNLLVGTEEEFCIAGGSEDIDEALQAIRELTGATLVLKTGEAGCRVYAGALDQSIIVHGYPVKVMNVLGAGDAFMSGFLRGWLRGQSLSTCGYYANACGAITVSRHACAPAIPSYQEMRYFISHYQTDMSASCWAAIDHMHQSVDLGYASDQPMYTLAFDHRIQFESSCNVKEFCHDRIVEFKQCIYRAFVQVAQVQQNCALLLDPVYGQDTLIDANAKGLTIGVPIECAGTMPLQWLGGRSLYQTLLQQPSHWFVKVLWHYSPSMEHDLKQRQLQQLMQLNDVCHQLGRRWMLELVIPEDFPFNGKEVSAIMRHVYAQGMQPYWWKLAALVSEQDWDLVEQTLIERDPNARVILLGGTCQQLSDYKEKFALAKQSPVVNGFAIGRSIFWQAWVDWSEGRITSAEAEVCIAKNYQSFIAMWQQSTAIQKRKASYVDA
ncbi:MAG: 5-dehydro-2-deoxygluconokinase [Coxiellaceae bacterium]|nr:5-dehydro-2-deoxygluconokinase [Coxiellaceae bacterium]